MHPHESLIRTHVEGEGSERERQEVDEHLKGCSDCQEFLSFAQDFSETAKDLAGDEIAADEPHASKSTIIAYEEGKLDAETALHLRSHMLFCDQCAEAYYLLKRMRAPSWTEVVIEIARSAKEFLLKPIEITGMGELIPVPATITRGPSEESEEGQSRIEIAQHVMDSGEEADIFLYLEPEDLETRTNVRLLIGTDPPKPAWRANLLDAQQKQIASVPLTKDKQILHSSLAPGGFVVQVASNEDILAECRLNIQASDEQAPLHRGR
jgi:hypothetical protein